MSRGFSLRDFTGPQEPPRRPSVESDIDRIFRDAEQGQRAQQRQQETENEPVRQLTRNDLKTMTPAQIEHARKAGQCDDLLRGGPPQRALTPAELRIKQLEYDGITQATEAELKTMSRTEIVAAQRAGRLTAMLAGIPVTEA